MGQKFHFNWLWISMKNSTYWDSHTNCSAKGMYIFEMYTSSVSPSNPDRNARSFWRFPLESYHHQHSFSMFVGEGSCCSGKKLQFKAP